MNYYICFCLGIFIFSTIVSCDVDRASNPAFNNTDFNLTVYGPFDIGEMNDSFFGSENYFGPKNIMQYSGYYFYVTSIENNTKDTLKLVFNTDSLGVLARLDFSKCGDKYSCFCNFGFNYFDQPDKIILNLMPFDKCNFLIPLAPISFPLETLLIQRRFGIPAFYTCFFPELENPSSFFKDYNFKNPQSDACFYRNNGISINKRIPISTIMKSFEKESEKYIGLLDITSCNELDFNHSWFSPLLIRQ